MKDGNIVSAAAKGSVLSDVAYDPHVIGVVARDAAITLNTKNSDNGVPVISNGTVYVLVSSKEGAIKKGDLITTTSLIPGVGVKATKDGYVIGNALEDYDNPNPQQTDKIAIELDLHYFNSKPTFPGSLSDIFKIALLPIQTNPKPL